MFCGRGRHLEREAVTNGARKNINQNVRNLRTEVELEADTQKKEGGNGPRGSRACKTLSHKICNLQSRSQLGRGRCRHDGPVIAL